MTRSLLRRLVLVVALAALCAPATLSAAMTDSYKQFLLARDESFLARLQVLMVTQARVVKAEALATAAHTARSNYATVVINNPSAAAQTAALMIVAGANVAATITFGDFNEVKTSVSDADLFSQIATYWTALAGADSGS